MRKKILLVDDSNTALMLERMMLAQKDYEVSIARDGIEAVGKAIADTPDLIVMDVMMPRLDGFGACRRLRDHEETRRVPIILVTTRGEAVNVEAGYAAGCSDYITKPINSLEFLTKVRSLLGD